MNEESAMNVDGYSAEERRARLLLMDQVMEFIAEQAGKERITAWRKFHKLTQQMVLKFGCNTSPWHSPEAVLAYLLAEREACAMTCIAFGKTLEADDADIGERFAEEIMARHHSSGQNSCQVSGSRSLRPT